MIKNILIGTVLVLMIVASAGATEVRVDPASQTILAGNNFQVDVVVEDVVNMKGDAAVLNFDPGAMQVTGIIEGDFLKTGGSTTGIGIWDNTAGTAVFGYTLGTGTWTTVSGSGTLATIQFSTYPGAPADTYDLNLTDVELRNASNELIPTDVVDGEVIIERESPVLCTAPDPPSHNFGDVPEGQVRTWTFDVTNCGTGGTLTWGVNDDQPWIEVNPTSGTTTTETDTVIVTIDTTGLNQGLYTGTINVTSNGGVKEGTITVDVVAAPTPVPVLPVPVLSGIGMIALIAALAVVLAISVSSATRRRKK